MSHEESHLAGAIAVSTRWAAKPDECPLVPLLAQANVAFTALPSLDDALAWLDAPAHPAECLILHRGAAGNVPDARISAAMAASIERLKRERAIATVVAASSPSAMLVAAAFRAGAADVIDLDDQDEPATLHALERAAAEHRARRARDRRIAELRALVDEFLRVLIRLERRTLKLEGDGPEERLDAPPRVLIVDDDAEIVAQLEQIFAEVEIVSTTAYNGDEAVEFVEKARRTGAPIDLALVDKNLPGIDGLEAIRRMRELSPAMPTILITGYSSAESAMRAANLGVVGYVLKPFDDVRELAAQVKDLAAKYAAERRERRLLARIKQRHADFLERYQKVAGELDRLRE